MNDQPRKTTVTLEDLLRLKRAERPPEEFWTQFESGMRAKQLAAIVEPRPWWAPFIRVGARISRYQLPVGATAILAITFLTVREYHPASTAPVVEPAVAEMASLATLAPAADRAMAADAVSTPAAPSAAIVAAANEPVPTAAAPVPQADLAPPSTAAVGSSSHVAVVNPELTSARYIAENLAAAQAADSELDQMLSRSVRGVENRPARGEPLTQISVPGETRHSRLLGGTAWLASAGSGNSALRLNEQATRRLTEQRLAESDVVRRIDLGGDRLTLKF
jgi:hypothetical protein